MHIVRWLEIMKMLTPMANPMYKTLAVVYLRSLSDSFWRSISPQHVPRVAANEFVFYGTISTAAEETTAKSMQLQIVDALRFGERSKACDLLSSLGHGNYSLKANDFIDILRYCARSPDPLFVIETWRVMEENQINPNHTSCLLMMQTLCDGGYLDEAFRFLNVLGESQGNFPPLSIYNTFLAACARKHSTAYAIQCLDVMESRMVGLNQVTYWALLKLAVFQKNLSSVQKIWNEYIKKYSPNILCTRKFIWSFSKLGDLNSAYEVLQQMVDLAMRDGASVVKSKTGKISNKFDIPIPLKHDVGLKQFGLSKLDNDAGNEEQDIVLTINDKVPQHDREDKRVLNVHKNVLVMKLLRWSFNDVIHASSHQNNCGLAEKLLVQMQSLGIQPSSHTYDGIIKAVVRERGFNSGMELLKIMQCKELKACDQTLATLSIGCSQALELGLAEAFLHQISDYKYAHPFNMFFAACDRLDKPECAMRAFAKLRKLKILPDIRTYELLFSLFGTVNAPYERGNTLSHAMVLRRIKAIEMDMEENGIQHSHISMKSLLKALGAEQMIEIMIEYLQKADSLFGHTQSYRTPIFNTVLHSLVQAKKSSMAVDIFKIMRSGGVSPDSATYNIMVYCCTLKSSFRSAYALVSLMFRDGFYLHVSAIDALVKILLNAKKFDEALGVLDQALAQGIQFDVVLFNTILRKASKMGMIDVIEFIVERMHQEKIKPDASTCGHVFSAYVECGLDSTAREALQVLSLRMLCEEYGSLSEEDLEIIRDELILTEDDSEAEKRTLQLFENYEENLAVALLNLRWSAMLNFPISWSPDHSAWAQRLATTYSRFSS